ncbi:hypothetical protein Afil01_34070 [Actinorhabdospora filicis]|uniref:Mycothiol-dependent maleylpyruvate isomerase metal-binding domain-containing protein n=1 Tax=Actinorhabdospora filicis TaxID=1785913 RepID=A0A9W6SMG6_9ACTN|nr:maleylpyruvate isomerase N-terminal domain-containing protein [Actinorhabdospora filicis]GLZ78600.1 hypothetical protein Afil01_34070 [Actinorhabdospora filicis]
MNPTRTAYLTAADIALALLADDAVAATWERPSALAEFGVAGLAGHLAYQVSSVPEIMAEPVPGGEPRTLLGHYESAAWIDADIDHEVMTGIRRSSEDRAAIGHDALVKAVTADLATVRADLATAGEDRQIHLAGRWSLTLDDFLVTRTMELVVHSDDLAVSVGVATPEFPDDVTEPVIDLLARLSVKRRGALPLVRALSRAERAPETVTAF